MRYPRPSARGGLCEAGPLLLQFTFREGTFGGGAILKRWEKASLRSFKRKHWNFVIARHCGNSGC